MTDEEKQTIGYQTKQLLRTPWFWLFAPVAAFKLWRWYMSGFGLWKEAPLWKVWDPRWRLWR